MGGAETVLLNLFTASEELRRRSLVVTLGFGNGDLPGRLRAAGAEVVELKMARLRHAWKLVSTFRALRELVRASGVRAVVGNGGHPQVVGGLVARLAGVRSAFVVHAIYPTTARDTDPRDLLALHGPCDLMMPVSKAAQAALTKIRRRIDNRLLYNGTPQRTVSSEDARAARAELGATDGEVVIGSFGRLQRWKGQDVFIAAARSVARERPQARFVVVGGATFGFEADYAEGLKAAAAVPELEGKVTFTGFRTDVPRLMAACDVVCHTSRVPEPFGLVIVEAMALGRAVIATAGGGPSEIISSPQEGVLIAPDDPRALAATMRELIDDPDRRARLGDRGRERVRTQFSIDVMASTLLGYIDRLIGRAG
jgi:glycosyltransferase involved in cell wall biosynthesis